MACFPRLFNRKKGGFTPAEDGNTDTVLNNNDNPVQIGRYIRREETPVFTPKSSDRSSQLKHRHELGEITSHNHTNNNKSNNNNISNNINNSSNISSNNTSNISNSSSNSNSNHNNSNNNNKKFISKKNKCNNNSTTSNSNNSNSLSNSKTNSTNTNTNANHTHLKLKPVKERRPTALPTDAPLHIEDECDEIDGAATPGSITPITPATPATPTTPTAQNAKFFIGGAQGYNEGTDVASVNSYSASPKNQRSAGRGASNVGGSLLSSKSTATMSVKSKFPSNNSNSSSSIRPKMTTSTTRKGSMRPQEDLHIPLPPPMPPQPLTTASSSASLMSMRSANARTKQNSNSNNVGAAATGTATTTATSPASSKSNHDLYSCTLSEVLNFSSSTTAAGNSLTGRDSGVQVEDSTSTPTPKDSDGSNSPQSHRVDGGIIRRRSIPPIQQDIEIEFIKKDDITRNLIRTAIEKNDFLNNYMDKERKEMVIDAMGPASYDKDCCIINEGDEGSEIYVSEEGYFDVLKAQKIIGNFGPATVFGELAILYNAPRFATIRAATPARVWKIDRVKFRNIMMISGSREREENLNFMRSAPFLNDLASDVLNKVVDLLQRKFYETNTCIVREGEIGNEFFIIRGGTVTIKKRSETNVERVVDRRKRGEYFGEQALLNADRRQASVYADAPGTEVLKLDREAFISYLGTIPQLREKIGEQENVEGRVSHRKSEFQNEYAHIKLTELKKISTLGAGAFGRVDLVSYNEKTFALKIIKKIDILKQDQIEHVYSEKHVMMKCRSSPFIIELYKTFRNEKFVYFLMEACMGGDVWTVMSQRRFFDEKTARFIAGCVVEAFDFLHSHNIIYRDLKPENLMLTTDGYCKLVDFGFAKHIPTNQKTNTFAGTPEYVAPEIILDRGHDRSVDYWALGILIYELLVGKTPFRGQNQIKIYQQILGGIDVIQMPSRIPKSAQGLIKHLCKQLPAERLGYQRKGILDIKKHSWFDSLDWQKLKSKQINSPIKRPITSNTDVQYFGPPGVENDHDPPDETSGWDIDF